jgi:hypothetical protein
LADAPAIGGPLELAPEQLEALNIADLAPGDSQTIVLKAQEAPEGGPPTFEVVSSDPVLSDDSGGDEDESGSAGEPVSETPEPEPDAAPEEGDDMAGGFKRKKKPAREGLPDTKKMRDL